MGNPKIVSAFNKTFRVLYFIGVIFFIIGTVFMLSNYNYKDVTTISSLVGALLFMLFASSVLIVVCNIPKIIIYSDRIELLKFFHQKKNSIEFSEIKNWAVRKKKDSKYGDYVVLYLTLKNKRVVKLNGFHYSNFDQIQNEIISKIPENIALTKKLAFRENMQISISCTIIGILFILLALHWYTQKSLTRNDISIVSGHLSESIKLKKRKSTTMIIKLEEHTEFNFRVGGMALEETYYKDLMSDFEKGDEIQFAIEKDAFEKKISKQRPLSFWDKIFHYDKIHIVEIINNDFTYLSLDDYNKKNTSNNKLGMIIFALLGSFLTCLGVYVFIKSNKKTLVVK